MPELDTIEYDLEMQRVLDNIKKNEAKKVLVQLPDGLRPFAAEIQAEIEKHTDAKVYLWAGSCFGACDVPWDAERLGIDLLVQWGHKEWAYGYQ